MVGVINPNDTDRSNGLDRAAQILAEQNRLQEVSYHTRKLQQAQRQVEYHTQELTRLGEEPDTL